MAVVSRPRVAFDHPSDYRDELTAHSDEVRFLDIPGRRYLMIDGTGTPEEPEFAAAISTLYPVAYTLHFMLKRRGVEAAVGALEGLYRSVQPPWEWRLLLPVPDAALADEVLAAIGQVHAKGKAPALDGLICRPWAEGPAAQIMHVGPYNTEGATIAGLHLAIHDAGLRLRGVHHEIYISDPNRAKAGRLKTLIRQPVSI